MSKKQRLDTLLLQNGLETSRERAKSLIMQGIVYVDGQKADKPGSLFPESSEVEVRGKKLPYVSRGGLKLEKAMEVFPISLQGRTCMDIGASTGGFTDCMLQNGAVKVYCIDVGYGQLAWKLRTDSRVVNFERTNVRYMMPEDISEPPSFVSIDVSFISLALVLPVAHRLMEEDGECVCLIKPQFEAGRDKIGKKGIVRDPKVHLEVIEKVIKIAKQISFTVCGLNFSPVKGPEGNIEFLIYLKKSGDTTTNTAFQTPDAVVAAAHQSLDV